MLRNTRVGGYEVSGMESIGYDSKHAYSQEEKHVLRERIDILRTSYGIKIPMPQLERLLTDMQKRENTEVQGLILEYNTLLQQYQIEARRVKG